MTRPHPDRRRRRMLLGGFLLVTAAASAWRFAAPDHPPTTPRLEEGQVWSVELRLSPEAVDSLRTDPRRDVPATLNLGSQRWTSVEVHLKGSTGSFQPVDDRPSLTLDFRRSPQGPIIPGIPKLHLNNSAEDPGWLNELLGSHLARALGMPAPRVAHARVTLNQRPLGLYILKEGFTDELLALRAEDPGPGPGFAIAEPQVGGDIDGPLESRSRRFPEFGRQGLPELTAACREPDPDRRWRQLQTRLDADAFASFMALEIFLGHRDGYCTARNNFRVASNPDTGRTFFLPHGMDQLLGNPDYPWNPQMAGLVARAFIDLPQGRSRYRQCLEQFLTTTFQPEPLAAWLDRVVAAMSPQLSRRESRAILRNAGLLKERLRLRVLSLHRQLREEPAPNRSSFENGFARPGPWPPLAVEFGVHEGLPPIALICEPRASADEAWFDADSLRLTHLSSAAP